MDKAEIERLLIPRLKIIGMILIVFALIALIYSFFPAGAEEEELILSQLTEEPPMINIYIVTASLGSVGIACIAIALKKMKEEKLKEKQEAIDAIENSDR